jgi:hypothetical protein
VPRLRRPLVLVPLAVAVAVAGTAAYALPDDDQPVIAAGPEGPLNAESRDRTEFSVDPGGRPVRLLLDGEQVAASDGEPLRHTFRGLADGEYELVAEVERGFPRGAARTSRALVVDTTPPVLELADVEPVGIRDAVTVAGRAEGAVRVTAADQDVEVSEDGSFELAYDTPPSSQEVVAVDAAGNRTTATVDVPVAHPGMRAVHMTALAWTSATLREPILQLAREGRIDTIQLDIKDESGDVGHRSAHPLANEVGAVRGYYDAEQALAEIHALGLRVVGRIVAFRDPVLAPWAFANGKRDWVIQHPDGSPYQGRYGGFTNFASPEVRRYNIELAVEAAELGFDDILYDYCRRPDGPLDNLRFPGLTGTPEEAVALFMEESRAALRPLGVYVGASVYGIAADRPTQIAQDIPAMSRHLDYVAPMVYPSHWGPGEYGVADPARMPGPIVERSLAVFQDRVEGTQTKVMPWLQDFSLGVTYGPAEVRAQIDAARRVGIPDWILWNAGARYQGAALDPVPRED